MEGVYVLDIDSVVDGSARRMIVSGELAGRILVHKVIVEYLYKEARRGLSRGFTGLSELAKLMDLSGETVEVVVVEDEGRGPRIRDLDLDDVKKIIRDYAWRTQATLVTSDRVQAEAARAMGIPVYSPTSLRRGRLRIEEFFDERTMSVHLKEGAPPLAKVGRPGRWVFVTLSEEPL